MYLVSFVDHQLRLLGLLLLLLAETLAGEHGGLFVGNGIGRKLLQGTVRSGDFPGVARREIYRSRGFWRHESEGLGLAVRDGKRSGEGKREPDFDSA